jgi:hypothetical protein
MRDLTAPQAGLDRECPHCKRSMPRTTKVCPHCRSWSPPWILSEGRWWVSVNHVWYCLDEASQTWNPVPASAAPRGIRRRTLVKSAIVVTAIVLLAGGCAGFLVYAEHYDAQLKKNVTAAMRELPIGSSPADMRSRLGDPDSVDRRRIHGQRAFCMGYITAVFAEGGEYRYACYVHGRRVR